MATIRFYTRTKSGTKLATVFLRFVIARETDIRVSTPYRIVPSYWNDKKQCLRQRILFNEEFTEEQASEVEETFTGLKKFIMLEHMKLNGPASSKWLRETVDKFYYKQTAPKVTLNEYIEQFVADATSGKRLASANNISKRYSYGSLRALRGFMLSFNLFQGIETPGVKTRAVKGKKYPKQPYKPLDFDDITIDTYNDFVKFFYDRGCGVNYIGKHIRSFKTIMRKAREEGLHNNAVTELRAFKAMSEPSESIYLSESELEAMRKLDLSGAEHLEIARDVFLAGCYMAQRYSDYSHISKNNLKSYAGNPVIELIQVKTGEKCIIPIRPELDAILRKYDYTLPKTHEQKVNKYIKEIGKKAGITEVINYEQTKGGMTVKKKEMKCNLIKTHTARRTGCTLMYLAGIPLVDIMKISGHKTEKEFMKYIKVTKEETAISLANHPYFKGALKVV